MILRRLLHVLVVALLLAVSPANALFSSCQSCQVVMPVTCNCLSNVTGPIGPQGAAGTSFVFVGAWLNATTYTPSQVVVRTTSLYVNSRTANQGNDPQGNVTAAAWSLLLPANVASLSFAQVTSVADVSSSTATVDVIGTMALVASTSGTYSIHFGTSVTHTVGGAVVHAALFVSGTLVAYTDTQVIPCSYTNTQYGTFTSVPQKLALSFTSVQTLVQGQTLDVRWWTTVVAGGTRTAHAMTFNTVKLA